ncbi:hypothetical protein PGT21_027439 [Puccinia graminis f. sp. tritici]|uniref:Uncharacterized protein n=1 Tax=Puccinia graminis f. sp. tritici TaxID=56615 RepID=A0A5B0MLU4_PUCGR|nr:hypothetical protein PGT21_027439 [Puccinia graminis f. sp. tritici]
MTHAKFSWCLIAPEASSLNISFTGADPIADPKVKVVTDHFGIQIFGLRSNYLSRVISPVDFQRFTCCVSPTSPINFRKMISLQYKLGAAALARHWASASNTMCVLLDKAPWFYNTATRDSA